MSGSFCISVYKHDCFARVSVYTDTVAVFCKLLIKRPQTVMFSNYIKNNEMSKTKKIARKVYVNMDQSVSAYTDTD